MYCVHAEKIFFLNNLTKVKNSSAIKSNSKFLKNYK